MAKPWMNPETTNGPEPITGANRLITKKETPISTMPMPINSRASNLDTSRPAATIEMKAPMPRAIMITPAWKTG